MDGTILEKKLGIAEKLAQLNEIAQKVDDIPTFTSNDRAFLEELPGFPVTDGKKVLTATTSSGDTVLSYEEVGESTNITTQTITGTTDTNGTLTPEASINSDDFMVISAFSSASKVCIPVVAQSDGTWRFRIFDTNMQPLVNTEVTVTFSLFYTKVTVTAKKTRKKTEE